jgi:hypothetical protein
MRYLTIFLAVMVFYLWGEQRILRSSFLKYVGTVHLKEARAECTKVANAEQEAGIDLAKDH